MAGFEKRHDMRKLFVSFVINHVATGLPGKIGNAVIGYQSKVKTADDIQIIESLIADKCKLSLTDKPVILCWREMEE